MRAKDALGRRGERLAAEYLAAAGHDVIGRNWRCAEGEIDLVTREGGDLVFVEVKTRASMRSGHPLEAVTPRKLARLRRLVGRWIAAHPGERGRVRLDVIGIVAAPGAAPDLVHRRAVGY